MDRTLSEREAFRAVRCFLEQYNEREKSESLAQLIRWMEEGTWEHDAFESADPAQWHDWVACVDRVLPDSPGAHSPSIAYVVQHEDRGKTVQLGAFTTEGEAERLVGLLEAEGYRGVYVNLIPVHRSLRGWKDDR